MCLENGSASFQLHGGVPVGGKLDQGFRQGKFVRGNILAEENDRSPVVFRRPLPHSEFWHH